MGNSQDAHVFPNDEYLFGMRAGANAGFGLWQLARGSQQTPNATNHAAPRASKTGVKADGGRILASSRPSWWGRPRWKRPHNIVNSTTGAAGATNPRAGTAKPVVSPYLA